MGDTTLADTDFSDAQNTRCDDAKQKKTAPTEGTVGDFLFRPRGTCTHFYPPYRESGRMEGSSACAGLPRVAANAVIQAGYARSAVEPS